MSRDHAVRVPLAVDAQLRVPFGPVALPVRSLLLCAAIAPAAWLLLSAQLPGMWGPGAALFVFAVGAVLGIPEREGVWVGTYAAYGIASHMLPAAITDGVVSSSGAVRRAGAAVISRDRARRWIMLSRLLTRACPAVVQVPRITAVDAGVITLSTGSHVAVLTVEGPPVSLDSDAYVAWCERLMAWLGALECPARVVTRVTRTDARRARSAFDDRVRAWPATRLRSLERELVVELSARTVAMSHHVVLQPYSAGPDGVPRRSRPWFHRAGTCPADEAARVVLHAVRTAATFGIGVCAADRDDVNALERESLGLCHDAVAGDGVLECASRASAVVVVTALPASVTAGSIVDALLAARVRGSAALDIVPVARATAQRHLQRRVAALRHAARRGADEVEATVAMQDAVEAVAALASRGLQPVRTALSVAIADESPAGVDAAAARLVAALAGAGFRTARVTRPGLLPLMATSAGGQPLLRSVLLTTAEVAARLLPCLGTPFSDVTQPLAGINRTTGSPVYLSAWAQANHNLVVVGSSGAGKSVATKTLLVRHILAGATAAVIDPDSEYLPVMRSVGGAYVELGDEALNPFAVGARVRGDDAASLVLPVLAVMAGDERGVSGGRVVRRLPDEDQGWLHDCLVAFFRTCAARNEVPLLRDLVAWLDVYRQSPALGGAERDRVRVVGARLRRFTQGSRAAVFDRPSSFDVGTVPVAIGMKRFAMTYGADLTPALAVVLTHLLAAVQHGTAGLVVVVDEAHRVTSDPDAGEVLGQLVRQARKHGCGVWMATQRVEDFVATELGRTLASTAATKLVLGTEEAVAGDVRDAFQLTDAELGAICPMQTGTGVLIAGAERAVVDVVPGPALLAVSSTTPAVAVHTAT